MSLWDGRTHKQESGMSQVWGKCDSDVQEQARWLENNIESNILPEILLAKFFDLLQILGKGQSLVFYRRDSAYLMAQEMLTAELPQEILILIDRDFPPTGKGVVNGQEIRVAYESVSTVRTHTSKEDQPATQEVMELQH